MFTTVEVRWFFPGSISSEVRDWFVSTAGAASVPARRTDIYLVIHGGSSIGIKRREQYLEIKWLLAEYGIVALHQSAIGRMEQWRKWRITLATDQTDIDANIIPGGDWLKVSKDRILRRYSIENSSDVVPLNVDDGSISGCEVELTSIETLGERWWTFAFESFGEESILGHNLTIVGDYILSKDSPLVLSEEYSCSYPKWLEDRVK